MSNTSQQRKRQSSGSDWVSIDPTLTAWGPWTGLDGPNLKDWAIKTVLPNLHVFMEWRDSVGGADNQSPAKSEVQETMRSEFAIISQSPERFVQQENLTTRLIWAHTIHLIKLHLKANSTCLSKINDEDTWNSVSFDFLRFLTKNMNRRRCFEPEKVPELHKARRAFTDKTKWRLAPAPSLSTDNLSPSPTAESPRRTSARQSAISRDASSPLKPKFSPPASPWDLTASPPVSGLQHPTSLFASRAGTPSAPRNPRPPPFAFGQASQFEGTIASTPDPLSTGTSATALSTDNSSTTAAEGSTVPALSPSTLSITPPDKLSSEQDASTIIMVDSQPQTSGQLRVEWQGETTAEDAQPLLRNNDCALEAFKTWADSAFGISTSGEKISAVLICTTADPDSSEAVETDAEWARLLQVARANTPNEPVQIQCLSVAVVARGNQSMGDRPHFRDLDFSVLSTDSTRKERAYRLSHTRSPEETAFIIQKALEDRVSTMLVNRTPGTRMTAAQLNFDAANPFEGEEPDDIAVAQTPAFDAVQQWLSTPRPVYQDHSRAIKELQRMLGTDAEIIHRLPDRKSEDPAHPGRARKGDTHKPHQVTGLWWSLEMEKEYGVFGNADGCGTGKTHSYITHLLGATQYWQSTKEPIRLPTLVVCPRSLLEKTYEELHDQLGRDWQVFFYGSTTGLNKEKILFDARHPIYRSKSAAKTVIVISLSQIQTLPESPATSREGLFDRIIIDEAQAIRRCDLTKQGKILKSFKARFRNIYTGSPVVDTLKDLDGYLAFLEAPEWSSKEDLNLLLGSDERKSRYETFNHKLSLKSASAQSTAPVNSLSTPGQPWVEDCPSVAGLSPTEIQEKIDGGWRCQHWPACLKHNGARPRSLERRSKKVGELSVDTEPPFDENPYNMWHPDNMNRIKCCTTKAFRYYILPHLSKNASDSSRAIAAFRVQIIIKMLFLSRSLFSETRMADKKLVKVAEGIPPAKIFTQELRLSTDELAAYKVREEACTKHFAGTLTPEKLQELAESKLERKKTGSTFAKLSVLSTHIGFSGLEKTSTAVLRKRRGEGLPLLVARLKARRALNPADLGTPLDSAVEVVRQFLWGSPKMRFLLWEIERVILGKAKPEGHRKLLLFFQFPRSAEMCLKLVEYIGIRAVLLDTSMSSKDRLREIKAFHQQDSPDILITTYPLNIAGHDMQGKCCQVMLIEPAYNWATEYQAASRVYRIGQELEVEILRLFTEDTYQEMHEFAMVKKADSMFAAFQQLTTDSQKIPGRDEMTPSEVALAAFGMYRGRVKELRDVQSSKDVAKELGMNS
ncbi:P-loop containing nucleoside triphosphate hydrolase protein [Paraphoma chrysanthemicola]|uniref:P-loop containing nucleoside triphosphate hydrolase protein n=1 Tax=Paraphoma chrysanthemicola TaxID=798071 RepID=A0A8K0RJL2_9PLEO|nr:P-loop containing nucleoside triphosphate hydrolase protein [Paraphoma chrysanthemicola]